LIQLKSPFIEWAFIISLIFLVWLFLTKLIDETSLVYIAVQLVKCL